MTERPSVQDAQDRTLAEITFDRNVVVVAGAGTGKTTLLVNRLVHALLREPGAIAITELVALTFTNKAASEMKIRLRERLTALVAAGQGESGAVESGAVQLSALRERYHLSSEQIAARAGAALHDLEKAQIGTLHSFAAHLLRLYPIESGVDPGFQEDDGLRFKEHFEEQWEFWLSSELGAKGRDHARWRRLLGELELESIRDLARALCSELVPLEALSLDASAQELPTPLRTWLGEKHEQARALLSAHDRQKRRKAESMLAAAINVFSVIHRHGVEGLSSLEGQDADVLGRDTGGPPAGWGDEEFAKAKSLIDAAKKILTTDHDLFGDLMFILTPFVRKVRAVFLQEGWISFDGLLARARSLVRDHPAVRERLKQEYKAVLVDEFQDTDPIQYEIVLYLSERAGRCGRTWQEIDLAPGKLFIVGDPKQSIYAFRRADIEAFDRVIDKIRTSGGVVYELATNFRSNGEVLRVFNALFDRLLRPEENVQPRNVTLLSSPNRQAGVTHPGVELRLVQAERDEEDRDAAAATRMEAETLARWLKEELLAGETLTDTHGRVTPLLPGHVALLFRTLTQAQAYLEALNRYQVPYVTDGEKHFYRRQEVIDLVNILRVVDNPHDTIALVGVLRSSLGGVTDREIYELRLRGALDYRRRECLSGWSSPRAHALDHLYQQFIDLSRSMPRRPLPEALDLLFAHLPILELAAASAHGEQAMANLVKVRDLAGELADRPSLTLTGFVDLMIARLEELPEETESALREESLDAVRVLTIHKAKGLEFPVVVLPGLHHGKRSGNADPPVSQDWSSGLQGMSIGGHCSLGAVVASEKRLARETAEARRVFYVGMTRARERVILSGGLPARESKGAFLELVREAVGENIAKRGQATVSVGDACLSQAVITAADQVPRTRTKGRAALRPPGNWSTVVGRWEERERTWAAACSSRTHLTPALLVEEERRNVQADSPGWDSGRRAGGTELSSLIGTLTHRVLERWDFADDPRRLSDCIQAVCMSGVPSEWADQRGELTQEVEGILQVFRTSSACDELRRASILGREVPFTIPWAPSTSPPPRSSALRSQNRLCVMDGFIDLVYQLNGETWIADYKTDRALGEALASRVALYRLQTEVYAHAVAQCLGLEKVGCKLIFLRSGEAVVI